MGRVCARHDRALVPGERAEWCEECLAELARVRLATDGMLGRDWGETVERLTGMGEVAAHMREKVEAKRARKPAMRTEHAGGIAWARVFVAGRTAYEGRVFLGSDRLAATLMLERVPRRAVGFDGAAERRQLTRLLLSGAGPGTPEQVAAMFVKMLGGLDEVVQGWGARATNPGELVFLTPDGGFVVTVRRM
jgi:hypothetical protein